MPLVKQCEEITERSKLNKKLFDLGKNVEISYPSSKIHGGTTFPSGLPLNMQRLEQLLITGEYSDVDIYIGGHGLVAQPHKIILGLWNVPFLKMFTNGMSESISSKVLLQDVPLEAFKAMLEFMYYGELNKEDTMEQINLGLLSFIRNAEKHFWNACQRDGVLFEEGHTTRIFQLCTSLLDEEADTFVCPILQVISSVPPCKLIEETCEKKFSMHFDYCTTASIDFVLLDEATFSKILRHPDLTPFLERSDLSRKIPTFDFLVKEAICYLEFGLANPQGDHNARFQHRRSSFKERQYICDGDSNGLLYFIGTSFGKHQWVNPVLAKRICVCASSPISRHTDPKVLVSRTYQGTTFAGPRIEDGKNCTRWIIDTGQDHQGSLDGKTWTNLRVHENDRTMCKPGQFASWPIIGPNALLPFRFFRVILTAPTTDDANPWNFCICFLELYGYFH
ncbi:unnamed protein product [Camellia sinensis]